MSTKNRVFCYRNLNRKGVVWSVRDVKTGLVIDRAEQVILKDVTFHVSQKGRARVLKEKRKNVHAGVKGTRMKRLPQVHGWTRAEYNPYKAGHFRLSFGTLTTSFGLMAARYAKLTRNGLYVLL
jgi:hypothetical protein